MHGVVARRGRVLRAVVVTFLVLVVAVAVWLALCFRFVVHPTIDEPGTADAVVVLGGDEEVGWREGRRLVDDGVADELVVSTPVGRPAECDVPPPGIEVTCFVPEPSTTRGEAQMIRRLAEERGWDSVVVVTWRSHIARSRLLVERCFDGDVRMVEDHLPMDTGRWWSEFLYQSGAWVKTQLTRDC